MCCTIDDIVVLELSVPRTSLTRHARGVWYDYSTITPEAISAVRDAREYGPGAE